MRTSWTKVATTWALVASVVVGAVVLGTAGPAAAAPSLTVTPSTDLQDGQVVHLEADGFISNERVRVVECTAQFHCRSVTFLSVDASGHLAVDVVAHAFIRTNGGSEVIFLPGPCDGGCTFGVIGADPVTDAAFGPVAFVPDVAILDPTVGVTPGNGLVDGQSVQVQVPPGYFDLGQPVHLSQCVLPVSPFSGGPCGPLSDATASATDASVDVAFTVHNSFIPLAGAATDPVDCRLLACGVYVTGQRYDFLDGPVAFATAADTTTILPPTTTPAVTATPRFTG